MEVTEKVEGWRGGLFGSVLTTQTYAARGQSGELQTTDYTRTPAVRRSPLRMSAVVRQISVENNSIR